MIDIHAHFLPGVDDGPRTLDEAVAMCRMAADDGVRTVFCTSHLMADGNSSDELRRRDAIRDNLQTEIDRQGIPLLLKNGAEWMLSVELIDTIPVSPSGMLGSTNAFLFEISRFSPCTFLPDFVQMMVGDGYLPIFAHPERYPSVTRSNFVSVLTPVVKAGAVLQLTNGSFTGLFGNETQKLVREIANQFPDRIVLASDAHEPRVRIPGLSSGFKELSRLNPRASSAAQSLVSELFA